MIFESMILSILVGFVRRGVLANLAKMPLRRPYLFVLPFAMYIGACALMRAAGGDTLLLYLRIVNILQYALLLAAIALNIHIVEMRVIGAGTFANSLVLTANGGVMPVSLRAADLAGAGELFRSGRSLQLLRHVIMTPDSRLKPLADIIPVPGFGFRLPEVASVGDVLIAIGIFVLVQRYMCSRLLREK